MKKKWIHIITSFVMVVSLTLLFFNYSPSTSYACSCAVPESVKVELEKSSAVFSGKVLGILDKKKFNSIQSSGDELAVLFEVDEAWKGINQTQVIVYTSRDSASCGFEFTSNEYLVYANKYDGELRVSLCSRTTLLSLAQEDLNELSLGDKPTEEVKIELNDAEKESVFSANFIIISSSIFVLLIVAAIYIIRRVEKRNLKG